MNTDDSAEHLDKEAESPVAKEYDKIGTEIGDAVRNNLLRGPTASAILRTSSETMLQRTVVLEWDGKTAEQRLAEKAEANPSLDALISDQKADSSIASRYQVIMQGSTNLPKVDENPPYRSTIDIFLFDRHAETLLSIETDLSTHGRPALTGGSELAKVMRGTNPEDISSGTFLLDGKYEETTEPVTDPEEMQRQYRLLHSALKNGTWNEKATQQLAQQAFSQTREDPDHEKTVLNLPEANKLVGDTAGPFKRAMTDLAPIIGPTVRTFARLGSGTLLSQQKGMVEIPYTPPASK